MSKRNPHAAKTRHADGIKGGSDKQRVMSLIQREEWLAAQDLCSQLCQQHPQDAEAWFLLGAIHGQQREFSKAAECCRRTTQLSPQTSVAHYNLGIALHHLGDFSGAIKSFQEAIRLQPNLAAAHHDLGSAYQAIECNDEAVACYRKALSLQPGLAAAYFNLAQAYRSQSRDDEAILALRQGLQIDITNTDAHLKLAEYLTEQQQLAEAAEQYLAALRLRPGQFAPHVNLGNILLQLRDFEGAVTHYRTALELRPDSAEAHYNLGNALKAQDKLEVARSCYERALQIEPGLAMACNNLGLIHLQDKQFDEAAALFRRATTLDSAKIEPWINLANLARELLHIDDALQALEHAISIKPDAPEPHWDRALDWLVLGDFERGWPEYESRRQGGQGLVQRKFNQPLWQGESLADKTILIHAEQGIGDEIMFASCYNDVIERARHVTIDCAPRLAPLFARSFPRASIRGGAQNEDPDWLRDMPSIDFQIAAGSLPLHLRNSLSDFPRHTGYLTADPVLANQWADRYRKLGQGIKVGISWRGGHISKAQKRSTTLDQWQDILEMPNIEWVNLQYGSPAHEIDEVYDRSGVRIHDWEDADALSDLDNFAAQISALDLVISVDNSTVHMAGALAVPTWVLQPYSPDWRWRIGCEDSYWYPSVRQFRQQALGSWHSVFKSVAERLILAGYSRQGSSGHALDTPPGHQ